MVTFKKTYKKISKIYSYYNLLSQIIALSSIFIPPSIFCRKIMASVIVSLHAKKEQITIMQKSELPKNIWNWMHRRKIYILFLNKCSDSCMEM